MFHPGGPGNLELPSTRIMQLPSPPICRTSPRPHFASALLLETSDFGRHKSLLEMKSAVLASLKVHPLKSMQSTVGPVHNLLCRLKTRGVKGSAALRDGCLLSFPEESSRFPFYLEHCVGLFHIMVSYLVKESLKWKARHTTRT